jgi:hypothetical protein
MNMSRDPFAAFERLAECPDIYHVDDLLAEARRAAREIGAINVNVKADLSPRLVAIMTRIEKNKVFHDPRAARAVATFADIVLRLT